MIRFCFLISVLIIFFSPLAAKTTLEKGDIVVIGVNLSNNNNNCNPGSNNYFDNFHFLSFKSIETGTQIDITDNGYNRVTANYFGTSEGVLRLTRVGNEIPAGQIFSINIRGSLLSSISSKIGTQNEINGWQIVNLTSTGLNSSLFGLNAFGDQFFLMQGGDWVNSPSDHGNYNGRFLYTYNSRKQWLDTQNSTNHSGFLTELNCFHLTYTNASSNTTYRNFGYYKGDLIQNLSKGEWLIRFLNNDNWINASGCVDFTNNVPPNKILIKDNTEQILCLGDIIQPLNVVNESTIVNYEWFKSDNIQIGDLDDELMNSGTNLNQYNPAQIQGDYHYYCRFSVKGYDNTICYFYSNLFRIKITAKPKITSINMN